MSKPRPGASAEIQHRVPLSVPGKFFVDDQCLDCDLCRETAPNNFSRDDARGVAYVSRQPSTPEELALCRESVEGCPCEAIGDTGDQHDWAALQPVGWERGESSAPKQCGCHTKKPWWRFW
jgi:ferredoxin